MSQHVKITAVVALIAGLAVVLFVWGRDDDETAIHRQLDRLAERLTKAGGESHIEGIGQARQAAGFFIDRPEIQIFPGRAEIYSREQLATMIMGLRSRAQALEVNFSSRRVTLAGDGRQAVVEFNARAQAVFPGDRETHRGRYRSEWRKEGGDWLIARVQRAED